MTAFNYGYAQHGNEVAASFGQAGTRYTFYASEAPVLGNITMSTTTAGSTVLIRPKGSGNLGITPINSSVFVATGKEWGNVSAGLTSAAGQNFVANMTVPAMVNDQKMWMPTSYTDGAFCVSSHSGVDYQSGQSTILSPFDYPWSHDISWDVRPTAYTSKNIVSLGDSKHSQILYPRTPSPRWFRRAALQKVVHPNYGSRTFFVYTDFLSRFYVYPVVLPKDQVVQSPGYGEYAVPNSNYRSWDVPWGSANAEQPSVDKLRKIYEPTVVYSVNGYTQSYFLAWVGDGGPNTIKASYPDPAYDNWMGVESGFDPLKWVNPYQYLWSFNYNATKATTVAFKKGTLPFTIKDFDLTRKNTYKFVNGGLIFSDAIKEAMGNTGLLGNVPMSTNTVEQVYEYYPVLLEVDININLTGTNPEEFNVNFSLSRSESSDQTNIYYLSSGYTHPVFNGKTIVGGNELVYVSLECYGDTSDHDNDKCTDTVFETHKDSQATIDIPTEFTETAFLNMLISGEYDHATVKAFIAKLPGYSDNLTLMAQYLKYFANSHKVQCTPEPVDATNCMVWYTSFAQPNHNLYIPLSGTPSVPFNYFSTISGIPNYTTFLAYTYKNFVSCIYNAPNSPGWNDVLGAWTGTIDKNHPENNTIFIKALVDLGIGDPTTDTGIAILQGVSNAIICTMWWFWQIFSIIYDNKDNIYDLTTNTGTYTYKGIDKLLYDYTSNTQVLSSFYNSSKVFINYMCIWGFLDDLLINLQMGADESRIIRSIAAQCLFARYEDVDISFNSNQSWVDNFYTYLPKLSCQVIDGVLETNTRLAAVPYIKGADRTNYGNGLKAYPINTNLKGNWDMYLAERRTAPYAFGKKINSFKTTLDIYVSGNKLHSYKLIDSPYVSIVTLFNYCATFPDIKYDAGLTDPYSCPLYLGHTPTQATATSSGATDTSTITSYFNHPVTERYWTADAINDSVTAHHSNSANYGLFIKANESTLVSNVSAIDLPSLSVMFYTGRANKNYSNYSVGSALYSQGIPTQVTGCVVDNPLVGFDPPTQPKLNVTQFNALYRLIAADHTRDTITVTQSTYQNNLLFTNPTNKMAVKPGDSYTYYPHLYNDEATVIASGIYSHPNGSLAAYQLPPYGFLEATKVDAKILGDYVSSNTIDIISVLNHKFKVGGNEPKWINTTHKEIFNSAFKQGRDYSYYTDPNSPDGYMGGFCTAGCFYDFELPKEYSYAAPNLAPSSW